MLKKRVEDRDMNNRIIFQMLKQIKRLIHVSSITDFFKLTSYSMGIPRLSIIVLPQP